ncbi:hypothetical protein [Gymnodinialimonas hymeniacidonis]|uniref:hypothetical protein n=1 Tax=Gymnodinialimonas hymeniacidonis TaxID=3126508 RepID=UPI0034C5FC72
MEQVTILLTCTFLTFCGGDGTCTSDTPLPITLDPGADSASARIWATPGATGRPTGAEIIPPLPSSAGAPLHFLARTRSEGALVLSISRNPSDDSMRATLRRHPDRGGNPAGPDAFVSEEVPCQQSFVRQ